MDEEKKEYNFLWLLENYSCNTAANGKMIISPKFSFDGYEGTYWELYLFPNGYRLEDKGNVSLFLLRSEEDNNPENILVKFKLSFLSLEGEDLHSTELKVKLSRNKMAGSCQFVKTEQIHLRRKAEYLPKDILRVCCKIWKGKGPVMHVEQVTARTKFLFEKKLFLHAVENFSSLQPDIKKKIEISSCYKKRYTIASSLYFTSCSCEEIIMEITLSDTKKLLRKCKLFLLDRSKNLIDCGGIDYEYDAEIPNVHKLVLTVRRDVILNKKSEYLLDEKLLLLCECIISTGSVYQQIEEIIHELPFAALQRRKKHFHCKDIYNFSKILSEKPSVSHDMKAIYLNSRFSDVELKTNTKSFKAHKVVLCARSPVFEAMLTNDMKEKNTDCILVDDLENDTVQQLLLFLYSDNIENLRWKRATQLYYAADKYQIGKLKEMCSSFLTENLNTLNASDLLLLADTHNDSNLKNIVEDFILKHEEQVFGSKEWEQMIETNPLLVIKTMHLKYKRRK